MHACGPRRTGRRFINRTQCLLWMTSQVLPAAVAGPIGEGGVAWRICRAAVSCDA
ncbi:hypothetical protein RHECNPAF_14110015 [Rhizobium etli CNPAF512]|nr:hypothetical protein RHECNPAF_14110015 [Rhizobium etli CNPAF512]